MRPNIIIDGHCHLASSHCIPFEFFRGVASNTARQITHQGITSNVDSITKMLIAQHSDHMADGLVSQMDEAGIAKSILLAPDFTFVFKTETSIAEIAAQHLEVRKRHPDKFYIFQGVDPRWGKEGYDFFEKTVGEYGFEGLKLYPPCGYSPSDKALYPLYEICRDKGLPVLLHTGPTTPTLSFEFANPYLIDTAAKDFPDINFILAHGGINFVEEAKLLCKYRPNVYLDISPFPVVMSSEGWESHLESLFKQQINHKIIFGTDWPVYSKKKRDQTPNGKSFL